MTGHVYRRFRFPKRTYRNQDLGPFVNHEMNRCIQCYRCVRYYRDYAGGRDLADFGVRDRVYFGRHEDGRLESEFSGNLIEVCPTGVFTDKTLKRHFIRKWDLRPRLLCASTAVWDATSSRGPEMASSAGSATGITVRSTAIFCATEAATAMNSSPDKPVFSKAGTSAGRRFKGQHPRPVTSSSPFRISFPGDAGRSESDPPELRSKPTSPFEISSGRNAFSPGFPRARGR